ncbi:MAG: outer membrane beta-barrel protein [Thermoanaerobaculia bacterium]
MHRSNRSGRVVAGAVATVLACLVAIPTGLQAQSQGRVEGFVGYYFAEELEENVSYGLRGVWMPSKGWGIMGSYERYQKNDGKGFGRQRNVDAEIQSLEASYVAYPWGEGFEIFTGLGLTDINVDAHVNNPAVDLTKSTLSIHAGIGYRAQLGTNLYLRPELRARTYEAGDNTLDFTASVALGWRWDND